MSRYIMKQDWFCLGNDYTIRDAAGEEVLKVDGRAFSFGEKLSVQTLDGREMAFIDQKLLSWGPTYEIWKDDRLAAVIKKKVFTLFRCQFTVDVPDAGLSLVVVPAAGPSAGGFSFVGSPVVAAEAEKLAV